MAGVSKDGAAAHQPKGHIMDVTTEAAASGSEQTSAAIITTEGEDKLSLTDAARTLARARQPKDEQASERRLEATQQATEEAPSALRAPAGGSEPLDVRARPRRAGCDAEKAPRPADGPGLRCSNSRSRPATCRRTEHSKETLRSFAAGTRGRNLTPVEKLIRRLLRKYGTTTCPKRNE
jgi:hypothetical protein